ncbi:DgyrCDS9429 [Dimorphilus gyrociliatus]|uniref:DgyrCDS9429 n=1 Tax=Dimorphilus gyrociliatus TaxID=2664684 RepID=A0A7I8VWZ4_9ANNE|nr:DgyrCDS9429 [Dimorphilus gyrociliatus]
MMKESILNENEVVDDNDDFLKEVDFFFPFEDIPIAMDQSPLLLTNDLEDCIITNCNEDMEEFDIEWQKINVILQKLLQRSVKIFLDDDRTRMRSENYWSERLDDLDTYIKDENTSERWTAFESPTYTSNFPKNLGLIGPCLIKINDIMVNPFMRDCFIEVDKMTMINKTNSLVNKEETFDQVLRTRRVEFLCDEDKISAICHELTTKFSSLYKVTSYRNGVYGICLMSKEDEIKDEEQQLFDSVYPIKDLNGLSSALLDNNQQDSIFVLHKIISRKSGETGSHLINNVMNKLFSTDVARYFVFDEKLCDTCSILDDKKRFRLQSLHFFLFGVFPALMNHKLLIECHPGPIDRLHLINVTVSKWLDRATIDNK